VGAEADVDSLEDGFELDAWVVATMARNRVRLVSTLCVMRSWLSFGQTSDLPRFATDEGRAAILERLERAEELVLISGRNVPLRRRSLRGCSPVLR